MYLPPKVHHSVRIPFQNLAKMLSDRKKTKSVVRFIETHSFIQVRSKFSKCFHPITFPKKQQFTVRKLFISLYFKFNEQISISTIMKFDALYLLLHHEQAPGSFQLKFCTKLADTHMSTTGLILIL